MATEGTVNRAASVIGYPGSLSSWHRSITPSLGLVLFQNPLKHLVSSCNNTDLSSSDSGTVRRRWKRRLYARNLSHKPLSKEVTLVSWESWTLGRGWSIYLVNVNSRVEMTFKATQPASPGNWAPTGSSPTAQMNQNNFWVGAAHYCNRDQQRPAKCRLGNTTCSPHAMYAWKKSLCKVSKIGKSN